jgi:hypothetical protein
MELLSPTNEESEDSPIWSHMIAFRIGTLPPIRISYSSIHTGILHSSSNFMTLKV